MESVSQSNGHPELEEKSLGKGQKRVLTILFAILLLDLLAFTCILPLFPSIMDYYSSRENDFLFSSFSKFLDGFKQRIGAPSDVARYNSVFFGGVLGSLFCFLQFLSSPIIGALSDVFGRKPLMLISVTGSLVSYILWAQATTFGWFVACRVLGGMSKASVSIATAVVADLLAPSQRGKGMAVIGISFSVGFLVGPSVGAYFAHRARLSSTDYFFSTPAYFAICLTILELFIIACMLPETLRKNQRKSDMKGIYTKALDYISPKSLMAFRPLQKKLDSKDLDTLCGLGRIYFLYLLIYSGLEFTLSFFTHLRFQYDSVQQGKMYLFAGFFMILIQGAYVRRIPASRQRHAAQWGLGFIIPAFLIIAFANDYRLFHIGLAFYSLASALVVPCLTTLVASVGSDSDKGLVLGVFRSLGSLARAIGPFLASAVLWYVGSTACYVIGGLLLSLPYILLRKL